MISSSNSSAHVPRRDFLSLAGKGLGLAALSSPLVGSLVKEVYAAGDAVAHLTPQQAAMDEDYWSIIQNAFTVTRGIINLNNGGVNPARASLRKPWSDTFGSRKTQRLTRCGRSLSRNRKRFAPVWQKFSAVTVKRSRSRGTPPNRWRFFCWEWI